MIEQRSLLRLILLSLITFGIYGIFFGSGYIKDINNVCVCDGKKSPNIFVVMLLSLITGGLYYLIWIGVQANRLKAIAPDYKLRFKESGGTVVLYVIFGTLVIAAGASLGWLYSLIGNRADYQILSMLCSFLFFIIGASMVLNSTNILIKNLNAVGKVFNEKCR
ncbi:MAG: DUF4234 domain-containing protein [Eubacteriales bacterium]